MLGWFCQFVPFGAEEPSGPLLDLALCAVLVSVQNSVLGIISHLSTVRGELSPQRAAPLPPSKGTLGLSLLRV